MNENQDGDNTVALHFDDSTLCSLEEAKRNINGVLANAMERLRGNRSIPIESLVGAMLPFIDCNNPVVSTWAVAFLSVSIERMSPEKFSLGSSVIPPLLESLGKLHQRLAQSAEFSTVDGPLEAHWISVSWLVLDTIVLNSGQKPMIDWDMDSFDTKQITCRNRSTDIGGKANKNQSGDLKATSRCASQSLFHLMLDVLSYWPGMSDVLLSPLGVRRIEHRSKAMLVENTGDQELPFRRQFGRDVDMQVRPDRLETSPREWSAASEAYLRYMKLACLDFAISPPRQGLLQELNNDHALILSILFASYESTNGRIAMSYVKKRFMDNALVSLSVASNILVLVVGEAEAEELLDLFEKQYKTNFWENLVNSKSNNNKIRQPAIDWKFGSTAANFLLENRLNWNGSAKTIKIDPNVKSDNISDEAYATLLIELSLKLSEGDDDERKFLAMRLVSRFYSYLHRPQATIISKIIDLISNVLTILADSGHIEEDLRIVPGHDAQLAGGVPRPFGNRNDLNKLLQTHRQSLKRKNLHRDDAIHARKDAYKMIPHISAHTVGRSETSPFQLPILLLQCAVFEEHCLQECLTNALNSTLAVYEKQLDEDQSLISEGSINYGMSSQQQATFLLPALLETVCSDVLNVRMNGIRWIQRLLVNMDAEAACCLAAHLLHDENSMVARMAGAVLDSHETKSSQMIVGENFSVSIIDFTESDGVIKVQNDLKDRSKSLAERLKISCEESMVLLLHFKFSETRAEFEYRNNFVACRERCGLIFDKKINLEEENGEYIECGICYDDIAAKEAYSLRCGHKFCKTCWNSYVTDASNEISLMNFLDLRCPHHGCSSRLMLHDLQRLGSSRLIPKWNDAILKKFVEEDASYRYCSGPDCGCVAVTSSPSTTITPPSLKVTCNVCTTSFCFGCGQNAHAPASCSDITQWNLLKGSSQLWVKQHSKPCPGCNIPIEKNQGCNHMQCSHCGTDFCWLCLKVLNSHLEPHTCNRYNLADSAEDDYERQALFTITRYEAHDAAAAFSTEQYENFDREKLLETFWFLDEDKEPEIMARALETLLEGREFLKNSYVAMLGLRKDAKRMKLHEDHHACLEMFTERLSQLTETSLHRLYTLQGQRGIGLHFRRLAFYTTSVTKYMERMTTCIK